MQLGAVCSAAGVVGTWTSTRHLPGKIRAQRVVSATLTDNALQVIPVVCLAYFCELLKMLTCRGHIGPSWMWKMEPQESQDPEE